MLILLLEIGILTIVLYILFCWIWKIIKKAETNYIYINKADKKPLGWVWSLGKINIVRLKGEDINEFKFFWGK